MNSTSTLPATIIEAFHLMWGNFPEPATLVHKSREVIAVNKACRTLGHLAPGANCAKMGSPDAHKGCLGNQALASRQAAYTMTQSNGRELIAFWLPLDGYPEFFVHFGVGTTIDYKSAKA